MPPISIIVPCYNEQATIGLLLEAIYVQSYPRPEMEVVIADGLSSDGTRQEIERFQQNHTDLSIVVVDNVSRTIPSGLNAAIQHARGEYIVRLDAHSVPSADYIERCIASLQAGQWANVGGVWDIRPGGTGWMAESIALAAGHPLGAGGALYRVGGVAQEADTVPFGAFRRELIIRLGGYDETLLTNEDYELNVRIRRSGGVVWLDPKIRTIYFARDTFTALASQYWRYGFWKARMARRYPDTLRLRQLMPPLFAITLLGTSIMAILIPTSAWVVGGILISYLVVLLLAGVKVAWKQSLPMAAVGFPLAIMTMHLSWGFAFLWGWFHK
jgi:glycosyltransferase involved in cell wall biosynthesis